MTRRLPRATKEGIARRSGRARRRKQGRDVYSSMSIRFRRVAASTSLSIIAHGGEKKKRSVRVSRKIRSGINVGLPRDDWSHGIVRGRYNSRISVRILTVRSVRSGEKTRERERGVKGPSDNWSVLEEQCEPAAFFARRTKNQWNEKAAGETRAATRSALFPPRNRYRG